MLESKICKYCKKTFYKKDFKYDFNRMITCGSFECRKKHKEEWIYSKCCPDCNKPICYNSNKCHHCISIGKNNPFYNKTHTEESKKKIKLFYKGMVSYRRDKPNPQFAGEKNPRWKGGITPINQKIRHSLKLKRWRRNVFKRDNYRCQECNARGGKGKAVILNAHHIKPFSKYPELRFAIDNGITLCKNCHKTHKREAII